MKSLQAGVRGQEPRGMFFLVPRMLLHRPRRGSLIPRKKLQKRADKFSRVELARDVWAAAEKAKAVAVRRNRRGHGDADQSRTGREVGNGWR